MSATWGRDWIKFYLHPSAQWELLPLSARGLGDEILRYVDRGTGTIALGKKPVEALCRLLGAHPRERRRVTEDLEALKADGFCSVSEDGVLVVRNYLRAQSAVSPVTERVRATRARQAEAVLKHQADASVTPAEHEQTFPERSSDTSKHFPNTSEHSANGESTATQRKDSPRSVTETPLLEETRKRLEEKREEHCPSPSAVGTASVPEGQPTEKVDPPKLELSAPPPAKPKAAKRSEDPPPFSWRSGLEVIATACARFALPGDREVTKEQAIALAKQVRTFPKLEDWKLAGEFLGANGEGWRSSLNVSYVASSQFAATVATARAWEKRGRPAMDRKGNELDPTKGPSQAWSHARMTDEEFDSLVEVVKVEDRRGRTATTR